MTGMQYFYVALIFGISASASAQQAAVHPEIVLQTGHGDQVDYLAFSGDGKILVSRGQDGSIKVWDLDSKTVMRSFNRDQLSSQAGFSEPVSLSSEGDRLLIGRIYGYAGDVTVADAEEHGALNPFLGPEVKSVNPFKGPPVTAVAESYDGRWKIISNSDGTIVAFDTSRDSAQIVQRNGSSATDIHFEWRTNRLLI